VKFLGKSLGKSEAGAVTLTSLLSGILVEGGWMIERLAGLCRRFPQIEITGGSFSKLKGLGLWIDPKRYAAMAISFSIASAMIVILALLIGWIMGGSEIGGTDIAPGIASSIALGGAYSILAFSLVFASFLALPGIELGKRTATMECELPFFLRTTGMLLETGLPFERALEIAASEEGELQREIRGRVDEAKEGMGLARALSGFSASTDSLPIKRAVSQILSTYSIGSSGAELCRMGDELLAEERHRLKEHSAKSALFGLLFMISSAVAPTFFLVYAILGRSALKSDIGEMQITIAMLVVFPLSSALILLISKSMAPGSALKERGGADIRLMGPCIIFMVGFMVDPAFRPILLGCGVMMAGYLLYSSYRTEKRIEEIEKHLPDALFSIGSLPKSTKAERIFAIIGEGGFGALSEEALKTKRQLSMNVSLQKALDDLWERNDSAMLKRACRMIDHMIRANALERISALAEDMIGAIQIRRERGQMMAMQKYTLVFGALLIPLILKMTIGLLGEVGDVFSMDGIGTISGDKFGGSNGGERDGGGIGSSERGDRSGGGGESGDGMSGSVDGGGSSDSVAETIAFASGIIPPYLVIYSLIASLAIADAEGRRSAAAGYFLAMAVAGLAAFAFINL